MSEQKKPKKLRIYKLASEYNLSSDSILEFLQEKGHAVKSHMSILSDEMLADIYAKYKKDIERAETHYQKLNEFKKLRIERKSDEAEAAEEKEAEETEKEAKSVEKEKTADETVAEDAKTVPTEEKEDTKETETEPQEEVEEKPVPSEEKADEKSEPIIDSSKEKEEQKPSPQKQKEQKESVSAEDNGNYKTKAEREMEKRSKGLKIVGKIDLDKDKKKRTEKKKPKSVDKEVLQKKKAIEAEAAKQLEEERKKKEAKKEDKEEAHKDKRSKKKVKGKEVLKSAESEELGDNKRKKKSKKVKFEEAETEDAAGKKSKGKKKRKKKKRPEVDKQAVDDAIKKTMMGLDSTANTSERASFRKRKRKEKAELEEQKQEQMELEKTKLEVPEYIAVSELANLMDVNVADVIAKCMELGLMVSINQRLDVETLTLVADEFGFEIVIQEEYVSEGVEDIEDDEEDMKQRPPVVTIMGHVDHGKTSLLDYIRRENVVAGESGGITQHIGAYKVKVNGKREIAFLDTPGHEAFTAMRARGASVTDIVVLIVAADDAVMPQTVEAINHSLAAEVPIIVAINKIDKPNSNIDKIRQQLADRNVLVEDWGGKYQCVQVSAKQGTNVDELLEKILLEAEMMELKANPDRNARGTVIESQLDKGRGITATILVQKGTLKVGDPFVAGVHHGRVRAMFDERNKKIDEVGPSTPVLVLGFEGAPQAGDTFIAMSTEREARDLSNKRQQLKREQDHRQHKLITLDEIAHQASTGGLKELPIIVKGDVDGSVEALADSLMKLSNEEVNVRVIHKGVGAISEGDIILAAASNAIIVGFHVRPHTNARKMAEKEKVDVRLYNVIYDAINEIKSALEGLLEPVVSEKLTAAVEVRDTFKVPKVGTIAGCYVQEGKINRNQKIRLFRDGVVIYEGELAQLKRFKDDVKEVDAGYECGLNIHNFNDVKIGDVIESYEMVEEKKKLNN